MADINKIKKELNPDAWKAVDKAIPYFSRQGRFWDCKDTHTISKDYLDAYKDFLQATDSAYVDEGFEVFDLMCIVRKRDNNSKNLINNELISNYVTKRVNTIYEY